VHRFSDLVTQLGIPRAVLTARLKALVQEGVLTRGTAIEGGIEYRLTDKGIALWPAMHALMSWGDAFYSPAGLRRVFRHALDDGLIGEADQCRDCGRLVPPGEILLERGPGFDPTQASGDAVSAGAGNPRRLLEPVASAAT
jgi:DNA-binding MarR family transcriptional regulator